MRTSLRVRRSAIELATMMKREADFSPFFHSFFSFLLQIAKLNQIQSHATSNHHSLPIAPAAASSPFSAVNSILVSDSDSDDDDEEDEEAKSKAKKKKKTKKTAVASKSRISLHTFLSKHYAAIHARYHDPLHCFPQMEAAIASYWTPKLSPSVEEFEKQIQQKM